MNINSLNAIKAYQKVNSFSNSSSKTSGNIQNTKGQVKSNTDTISFKNSAQGVKEYEAKVANIKNQVQNGTYKIDADKIASKILNSLYI